MTDSSGGQLGYSRYYPYGSTRDYLDPLDTNRKFTGQRLDGTGLYYYGARYYDPTIGRFISADTIVPNAGNPQSQNRYSYCYNNPLKYTDPTGHWPSWFDEYLKKHKGDGGDDQGGLKGNINAIRGWTICNADLYRTGVSLAGCAVGEAEEPPEQMNVTGEIGISINTKYLSTDPLTGYSNYQIMTNILIGSNDAGFFVGPAGSIKVTGPNPSYGGACNDWGDVTYSGCSKRGPSYSANKKIDLTRCNPNTMHKYYNGGHSHWTGTETVSIPSGGSASLKVSLATGYDAIPGSWNINLQTGAVSTSRRSFWNLFF